MEKSGQYIISAGLFFMIGMGLLLSVEPVWWSIVSVVLVFVASIAFLVSGLVARRAERATEDTAEQALDAPL